MTPLEYYQQQINSGKIFSDPEQLSAMQRLQQLHHELILENKKRASLFAFMRKPQLVKGIYLWGGVGIGKTFMMDCFYQSLPFDNKLRLHFHQFMRRIHRQLTNLQGKKDPLHIIAEQLSRETMVICFDEFFVSDITDAMLLGRLFNALFLRGVCLVATSNTAPDDLYKNGLQRSQFLPAIELIKKHTEVLHIDATRDYRLRHLQEAGVFYAPLDEQTNQKMQASFAALTEGDLIDDSPLIINDRPIRIKKRSNSVVWFDFYDICSIPRSQQDYLVIADQFKTVFISDIPAIQSNQTDIICLFINLVDVLYDAKVRLVISAAEPVAELYSRGYMLMQYARTHSRLLEMQSLDYFINEINRDNT